ncbi:MAG: SET domain-containing protein-lysine N-methyltransferase, partial [Patescibacteria group bacterium]
MEPKFEIKDCGERGKGLFLTVSFRRGEEVYRYEPRIVQEEELASLTPDERTHLDVISSGVYALIGEPFCYVNHSCEPNIVEKDRVGYAARDISVGEEITIDYSVDSFFDETMRCFCGSQKCRGMIEGKK